MKEVITLQDDLHLPLIQRVFCYLPFEHAEDLESQHESVRCFSVLRELAPSSQQQLYDNYLLYAKAHFDVIERFGRFPHRNQILKRQSTPDEELYLAEHGGFGGYSSH